MKLRIVQDGFGNYFVQSGIFLFFWENVYKTERLDIAKNHAIWLMDQERKRKQKPKIVYNHRQIPILLDIKD